MSYEAGKRHVMLQIGQNVDSASVLLQYRNCFGGGIGISKQATGRNKGALKWQISGETARDAAVLLSGIPSMKQAQLRVAASGPFDASHHHQVAEQLRIMKRKDHVPKSLSISWAYFAGLFDADGCIFVPSRGGFLQLEVVQVNPHVLERIKYFLYQQGLHWHLYNYSARAILKCTTEAVCKQTLELLLKAGLYVKKEQAELALTITSTNRWEIREAISQLKGHQGRYRRQDLEGLDLANQITNMRARLKRATSKHAKESLEEELETLCQAREHQKLVSKATALRRGLRKLVEDGASIMPLDQTAA